VPLKEEMSSFDIAALTPEINQGIKSTWIDNIYQINSTTLLLKLRQSNQPHLFMLIEAGKRLHLTSYTLEKPKIPPSFCMALRKHLKNGEVTGFQQKDFERTVVIKVKAKEGEYKLISEFFGGGNIILVSPQNSILQALFFRKMRDRKIWRGESFQFAPSKRRNPIELNHQDLSKIKNFGRLEIVRALTKFLSIGGLYAEEILLRAQIDKNMPCENLTEQEISSIFEQLHQIISLITTGNLKPCIVFDDEKGWIDVTPIHLQKYVSFKREQYKIFNEALDDYYTKKSSRQIAGEVEKEVEKELGRQKRILQSQQKALEKLKKDAVQYKKIGEMIYLHFNELQFLLQKITSEKKRNQTNILKEKEAGKIPAVYFHSLEPKRQILNVTVENLNFSLNLRRSIQANASDYYERAKKAEKKLEGVKKAIGETQTSILKLKQQGIEREKHELPAKRRKKEWYEKFRWFHSVEKFLVIGGRDASTNEILIKRHMEPHDKVFHADISGAPFVLIKTEGKIPTEQTINEATQLAASYSRAWKEGFNAIDVYWFSPQQINKRHPSGQHLKKGSFIISGTKNYVRNVPLRIAIGIKMKNGDLLVIGGPIEAIANQTNNYVEIIPGKHSSGRLAKQIQWLLAKRSPETIKNKILRIPLSEIQKFIPSGGGEIP